jgi:hypothetical protein
LRAIMNALVGPRRCRDLPNSRAPHA